MNKKKKEKENASHLIIYSKGNQETFWYSLFTTVHLTVGTNKMQEVKSYMDSSIEARECEHLNIFVRKLVNKCLEIQKTKN